MITFVFFSLDSQFRSINTLYTKPYARIGAYLAGVWTGYYLSKINRQWNIGKVSFMIHTWHYWFVVTIKISSHAQSMFNIARLLSLVTVTFLVFIQRFRVPENFWVSLLFPAFGRTLWSLPVCFFIVAGATQFKNGWFYLDLKLWILLTNIFRFQKSSQKSSTQKFFFRFREWPSQLIFSTRW